jgi:VIT1/CCC1 family predicted Fe2+/Mn2+ transporter
MLCGAAPLAPFALGLPHAFALSALLTGAAFFAVGSAKSFWSTAPWWWSGLTTLFVGAVAACLAYVVGVLTKGLL